VSARQSAAFTHEVSNQQTKKGKLLYEPVMKSIETMLPEELRDDTKRAVEACKGSMAGIKDNCESAFVMLKCLYKENPNFFFP
jgi:PBP/GOBP family